VIVHQDADRLKFLFWGMKFFLIGFMGAGKTTIGKYAARQNGLLFLDLDSYIEGKLGKGIREIFREEGEAYFRAQEREALEEVCAQRDMDILVSCGGGTPCFYDNIELMNAHGETIYLDMSAARLTDRLRNAPGKRPLLATIEGDLQLFVHTKLMERAVFYAQSKHIASEIDSNKKSVSALISRILAG
jgi:shikimate kinase